MPAEKPVRNVDHVDVLLDDDFARKHPIEVPVPQPPLQRSVGGIGPEDLRAVVISDFRNRGRPDIPALHTPDRFLVERAHTGLKIDPGAEAAAGFPPGVDDASASRNIHPPGFARKRCFPASTAAAACSGWK